MSFPNLSDLYFERLVMSVIDEDEEENTSAPGNQTISNVLHCGVVRSSPSSRTRTRANRMGGRGARGASNKQSIVNLVRLPGDVMKSNGVAFLFFKALRANLNRTKMDYYEARVDLAECVPEPVKNEFGLWDTKYAEGNHSLQIAGDDNNEYASNVWSTYLSKQHDIWLVLEQRYRANLREDNITTQHLYQPPYLRVEIDATNDQCNVDNFTQAANILESDPVFALHEGAFKITNPLDTTRPDHHMSLLSFWKGPLQSSSNLEGSLSDTTFVLMFELEQEMRTSIYNELLNYVACEIAYNEPKKMFDEDDKELTKMEKMFLLKQYVIDTCHMINLWEQLIKCRRLFMGLTKENEDWNMCTSIRLNECLWTIENTFLDVETWALERSRPLIIEWHRRDGKPYGFDATQVDAVLDELRYAQEQRKEKGGEGEEGEELDKSTK